MENQFDASKDSGGVFALARSFSKLVRIGLDGSQSPTAGRQQFGAVAAANGVQEAVGGFGDFDYAAHGVCAAQD